MLSEGFTSALGELLCLPGSSTSLQESVGSLQEPVLPGAAPAVFLIQQDWNGQGLKLRETRKLHPESPLLKCTVGITTVRISSNNKGRN